jgi:XTP/dITP diphosphohydrolase
VHTPELLLATSNPGKVREYQLLAAAHHLRLLPLPGLDRLPAFEESAPSFAENAAGKALHYSQLVPGPVLAEDSGLVVPALGGAPGPRSARYAGPAAGDAERIRKLLADMQGSGDRRARFVCVLALAERGELRALISDAVEGELLEVPRGEGGFGYDPIFFFPPLGKTFAELSTEEKNRYSHRGRAFRKLVQFLAGEEQGESQP